MQKKNYYINRLLAISSDIKKKWKLFKSILPASSKSTGIKEIKVYGNIITDQKQTYDTFNTFFVNLGPDLSKGIP